MRNIANADCEESFETAVTSLRESEYWNANERFRVWFEKQWLSVAKVSCSYCIYLIFMKK